MSGDLRDLLERLFGILIGLAYFAGIFLATLGFHFLVKWAEHIGINPFLLQGLVCLEFIAFFCDGALFIIFMLRSIMKFIRRK